MAILGFPDVLSILLVKEFYPLLKFARETQCSRGKKTFYLTVTVKIKIRITGLLPLFVTVTAMFVSFHRITVDLFN